MEHRLLRASQIFVLFLLLAVVFGAASIPGAAVAAPANAAVGAKVLNGNISARSDTIPGTAWQAATRPWTKERMQAAKPAELVGVQGKPAISVEGALSDVQPGFVPSAFPENAKQPSMALEGVEWFEIAAPLGYSYPAPFTRYEHFQAYTEFPYSTAGVLFFSMYGGDFRCSASSIGGYAIWTAGHCVHAGDNLFSGWAYDVVFIPAYKDGAAPFGIWTASDLWTRSDWYSSSDLRYDLGGAILNVNGAGKKISQVVGSLGFSFGQSRIQHWTDLGYPAASPFDGKTLQICQASHAYNDANFADPQPMAMGCDLTGGSSGGPWITQFSSNAGATNFLNGHNSYRYTTPNHPLEMYSPYFGSAAKSLYNVLVPKFNFLPVAIRQN